MFVLFCLGERYKYQVVSSGWRLTLNYKERKKKEEQASLGQTSSRTGFTGNVVD